MNVQKNGMKKIKKDYMNTTKPIKIRKRNIINNIMKSIIKND